MVEADLEITAVTRPFERVTLRASSLMATGGASAAGAVAEQHKTPASSAVTTREKEFIGRRYGGGSGGLPNPDVLARRQAYGLEGDEQRELAGSLVLRPAEGTVALGAAVAEEFPAGGHAQTGLTHGC